jgi:hypothetical protein
VAVLGGEFNVDDEHHIDCGKATQSNQEEASVRFGQ